MTTLVQGQNIKLNRDLTYKLALDIPGWSWGVIAIKNGQASLMTENESGVNLATDSILFYDTDVAESLTKLLIYIHQPLDTVTNKLKLKAELVEVMSNDRHANITFSSDNHNEKALILCELYRHSDRWKIKYVGQGYQQGLTKLFSAYKLEQEITPPKYSETRKHDGDTSSITMVWGLKSTTRAHSSQLYIGESYLPVADLRLGCLYQLHNGQKGLVQSIGEELDGSFYGVPYVSAVRSKDKHFEQLKINNTYRHKLQRYLLYALIVESPTSWHELNVDIKLNLSQETKKNFNPNTLKVKPVYAIAMLQFDQDQTQVIAIDEYFDNLFELDQAYGWGLPWQQQNQLNDEEDQ
jgi:uncharacterized protein involved in tellurium resistance